jgi:subtilisin family serine protease
MTRPREVLARLVLPGDPGVLRSAVANRNTIAVIDGIPDLRTEALINARVELRPIAISAPRCLHATFMASVIVGQRHGLVPGARLLAFGVTAIDGSIAPEHIARAVAQACREAATIIVIPLGDHREHPGVTAAIERARACGVVVVAAAGNAHPHPLLFPARLPGVIAVGACDDSGALLEDCCRAPRLDLIMPSLGIVAADAPGREVARSGTSVAAALAAGWLALELPLHHSTTVNQRTA